MSRLVILFNSRISKDYSDGKSWGILLKQLVVKVAEVIFHIREINDVARQKVEGYLTHKWAINSSLPSSHPHRFVQPTNAPQLLVDLGTKPLSTFNHNLGGLTGTTYYFRCQIINPNGISVFLCLPSPPLAYLQFPISLSSFVASHSANTSANLTSTGEDDANVTFIWGDNDAGSVVANWDHSFTFSEQGVGSLSHSISGLVSGTQYYFKD